jgi:hypothetical protein
MKRKALLSAGLSLLTAGLVLGPTPSAWPQSGTATAPEATRGIVISDHLRARARVEEINHADRTVVLKGEQGKTVELKVGPQAKNFDQVKVGDEVQADFYTSTVILLRKSDEPPSASGADLVQLAAPGETPGGLFVSTREITARIDSVDAANHTISLTGPRGNPVSLKIGDDVGNLDQMRPGDEVVVRYSEALALAVDKD